MTNKEYKERRQTLGLAIAALDKEHLEDREFADGEHVEIDYAWHKRIGVVCGCFIDPFGGYWWLAKSCPLLSLLIVLNQHFIKFCTMRQNFDGTKMGQNRRKIKPRPLCSEYPYQNTLILNTKVQICPVINEPMSLFLSSITHFSIILYHGRFFKVLDTLFHILQLNNVFLIVVQCSERLPIIETAHLYTPFVRLDSDFSVVMKCVALFPSMANCHLKVSHKDVVNCMLNQ